MARSATRGVWPRRYVPHSVLKGLLHLVPTSNSRVPGCDAGGTACCRPNAGVRHMLDRMARAKHREPYSQVRFGASVERGSGPGTAARREAPPILIAFRVLSALFLGRMARQTPAFGRQIRRHVGCRSRHMSLEEAAECNRLSSAQ